VAEPARSEIDTTLRSSSARPLDPAARAQIEPSFGYDFSQVRVHTDGEAARSAESLNARAYTVGSDIVFGAGSYAPESREGQRLIAHELAHVVQQSAGAGPTAASSEHLAVSQPGDSFEVAADTMASQALAGEPAAAPQAAAPAIQREAEEEEPEAELAPEELPEEELE